jgi:hypothetical protein
MDAPTSTRERWSSPDPRLIGEVMAKSSIPAAGRSPRRMTTVSTVSAANDPATLEASSLGWFAGVRYRMNRDRLDRDLANGVDPRSSDFHRRRAGELTSARERRRLASGYEHLLSQAQNPPLLSLAPVNWPGVRASAFRMAKLAERLRIDPDVRVRGVALAEILLTDGTSALHQRDGVSRLPSEVRSALAAL